MLTSSFRRCTLGLTQIQIRNYAARKGTREKRKKAKVKVEVQKIGFVPQNKRKKELLLLSNLPQKFDDSWKRDPVDDVFVAKYFKWIRYPFTEAVQCHKATHHPDMYNQPSAKLHVSIELNMQGEKKTRFLDNFSRIASVPNKFEHGEERTVLVFSKDPNVQKEATDAGAQLAGGAELIRMIQHGQISLFDYKYFLAHPDILPELVVLRGLMKRRFPAPNNETLTANLKDAVHKYLHGVNYSAKKHEIQQDFGLIESVIGTLDMNAIHLEENFASLIRDVNTMQPKREGGFIMRCILWSPPSQEKLMLDISKYLSTTEGSEDAEDVDERDQVIL